MLTENQLIQLLNLVKKKGVAFEAAIVGGMAVIAHGVRRSTGDYDILVDAPDFAKFQAALAQMLKDMQPDEIEGLGLGNLGQADFQREKSPASDDNFKNAIVALLDADHSRIVDFISVYYAYEKRGVETAVTLPGLEPLRLIDVPYLVLMKLQANGPGDRRDIVELFGVLSDEKRAEVLRVAGEYGKERRLAALLGAEAPELLEGGRSD